MLINQLMADLCVDESLDIDYWNNGNYSIADMFELIGKLFEGFVERAKEVQSFRKDGHGAGPIPDVRIPEQTPP